MGVALKEVPVVGLTEASTTSFLRALWSHSRHFETHWRKENLSTATAFAAPYISFLVWCMLPLLTQRLNADVIWQGHSQWNLSHVDYLLYPASLWCLGSEMFHFFSFHSSPLNKWIQLKLCWLFNTLLYSFSLIIGFFLINILKRKIILNQLDWLFH